GLRVAPHRDLLGQLGPAVERAEPLAQPLAGPRAVTIDGDVDALADGKARRVPPRVLQHASQRSHLVGEGRGADRARAHEAVAELEGPAERVRVMGAEPDRRMWA